MLKLKIGQYCAIMIKIKYAKFQVFLKLSTWASQPAKSARKCHFWAQDPL